MQERAGNLKRVLAGRDVLGALAVLLLLSGLTGGTVFGDVATMLATSGQQNFATLSALPFDLLVVVALYLQSVGVAALYRILVDVHEALQEHGEAADTSGARERPTPADR